MAQIKQITLKLRNIIMVQQALGRILQPQQLQLVPIYLVEQS